MGDSGGVDEDGGEVGANERGEDEKRRAAAVRRGTEMRTATR